MARIELSRHMEVDPARVWAALADLGSHAMWMSDARSSRFVGDLHRGVGTVMEVETRIGPLRTTDILEVTGWQEGRRIEVAHQGRVTGKARFEVAPSGEGTLLSWIEELYFPWWLGGPMTAQLAAPILAAVWRANLRRLEERLSSR